LNRNKASSDLTDSLFKAILSLSDLEECRRFFEDLCTISEMRSMAQRWEVASLLDSGVTFHTIAEATGASTTTISRVNRCLLYGADGYRLALERMKEEKEP